MAKPDTRKRDRAAYMRDYRAQRAKVNPSLRAQIDAANERIARLEEIVRTAAPHAWVDTAAIARGIDALPEPPTIPRVRVRANEPPVRFGSSRPAPKQKAKAR